jgi:hypothetical protein
VQQFLINVDFRVFRKKPTLGLPGGGMVNIMADGNFLATYLITCVEYEFDIKKISET